MLELLSSFWNQESTYTWWQTWLFASFLLAGNGGICGIVWFLRRETILECGYRKSRAGRAKKAMREWTLKERVLLHRLAAEATESSPVVGLSLLLNYGNLLCGAVLLVGYICALITNGAGWAMVLTAYPGLFSLFASTALTFIPDLLWVPSEQRRYGIRRKKK